MRLDRELYPEILCSIANDFSTVLRQVHPGSKTYKHILQNNALKKMYESLDAFVDYMASDGYCNDKDEEKVKRILDSFNHLAQELKVIVFNYTKTQKTSSMLT
jgi:hypothetical protein